MKALREYIEDNFVKLQYIPTNPFRFLLQNNCKLFEERIFLPHFPMLLTLQYTITNINIFSETA